VEAAVDTAGDDAIVVTARRREERLQDVPQSVTSIAGETLSASGISSTQNLSQVVPALNFSSQGAVGLPSIRGVGTTNAFNGDESNVSMYIDGVYQPDAFASVFALPSVERVEVLKGPQGTLFGRNSTGGSINITMRRPQETTLVEGTAGYGNFDRRTASFYGTTGLATGVAIDATVAYDADDGYVRDILRNDDIGRRKSFSVRSKLLAEFDPSTRLILGGAYGYEFNTSGVSSQSINGNTVARAQVPPLPYPTKPYETTLSFEPINRFRSYSGFVRLEGDYDAMSLSSQTSRTYTEYDALVDGDYTPLLLSTSDVHTVTKTWQQEFLASSPAGSRIKWLFGLFGYHASSGYSPRIANFTAITNVAMTTDSIAPFGEITVPLGERFSLTGGLRYTWERKKFVGQLNNGPIRVGSESWSELTPRAIAQYSVPDIVNLYASYSKGFKSGVYNTVVVPATPLPVDPETLDAFEIGAKTLARGPWRAEVSAYLYNYKDVQVSVYQPPSSSVLLNAAAARIYGFEASVAGRIAGGFSTSAFVAYTHARYRDFTNAIITEPLPTGGNRQIFGVDVSGNPTVRTPKWTMGLTLSYDAELLGGRIQPSVTAYHNSGFSFEFSNRLRQSDYTTLSANLTWVAPGDRYKVTLWGTNLTDELYAITGSATTFGDSKAYAAPRAYGIRLGFAFD
jgi:iron complex outermembrane receptor protein